MKNHIVLIVACIALLSLIPITNTNVAGEEIIEESKVVHVNMKMGDTFSPEYIHDNETAAQEKDVQADYDTIPGGKLNRRYVDVGTWTSAALSNPINMEGMVSFNLWVLELEDTSDTCDFTFDFRHNGETLISQEITGVQLHGDRPTEVKTTGNLPNPVNALAGDTISVYIQYSGWNDIRVYWDNVSLDSGAAVTMDSVIIFKANSDVSVTFYDAWGINWNSEGKYFCYVNNGGSIIQSDEKTSVKPGGEQEGNNGTYESVKITWSGISIAGGSTVTVTVNYGTNESASEGWTYSFTKGGASDVGSSSDDDEDFPIAMVGGGVVVVILVVIGAVLFIKKRNSEFEDDEYDEEYEEDEEYDEEDEEE